MLQGFLGRPSYFLLPKNKMEDNLHNTSVNQTISKLSADPGALVIGIISVVVVITGCCCGVLAIPVLMMICLSWMTGLATPDILGLR